MRRRLLYTVVVLAWFALCGTAFIYCSRYWPSLAPLGESR